MRVIEQKWKFYFSCVWFHVFSVCLTVNLGFVWFLFQLILLKLFTALFSWVTLECFCVSLLFCVRKEWLTAAAAAVSPSSSLLFPPNLRNNTYCINQSSFHTGKERDSSLPFLSETTTATRTTATRTWHSVVELLWKRESQLRQLMIVHGVHCSALRPQ